MEPSDFKKMKKTHAVSGDPFHYWPAFAFGVSLVIFSAILFFVLDNPFPKGWDEAIYFNRAFYDWHVFHNSGFHKLLGALLYEDTYHPPAYRILALPWNLIFGVHPFALRAHSLVFWCLSLWLIYLTGKSLARPEAGAFAVIYLAMSPMVINATQHFYTEYPFFFAMAGMFWIVTQMIISRRERPVYWIGFTACVALGGLAKFSFFFILAPFSLILLFFGWQDKNFKPSPLFLITSLGFGSLLFSPWWIANWKVVFVYLFFTAATFERHSLGHGISLGKFLTWTKLVRWTVLGPALFWITLILLITFVFRRKSFDKQKKSVIGLLLLSALPTLMITFCGTNNNPRFVTPALFPLALALGMIGSVTGWFTSWKKSLFLAGFIIWQLAVQVWPIPGDPHYQKGDESKTLLLANYTNMFRRYEQWDWEPVWKIISERGFKSPVIGELGLGSSLNPTIINYPWAMRNLTADVRLLWRYEMGPINWETLMREAAQCDVIVTAPNFIGTKESKAPFDNQYNAEFVRRLEQDPRFEGPIRLTVGKFEKTELVIFFLRTRTS